MVAAPVVVAAGAQPVLTYNASGTSSPVVAAAEVVAQPGALVAPAIEVVVAVVVLVAVVPE